jgi:transposase
MPNYFAYVPEQAELLPRHVGDELPKGHLCFVIHGLVEGLELRRFDEAYGEEGQKAYNPRLMLKVWLYGFAVNVRASRKLERRIQEDLGFRFLAGGLRPDHKRLSEFVGRQGEAREDLFPQVLGWARRAGKARLGRVAIDSTRIKANASPDRLTKQDRQQVRRWRREMEKEDPDQDPRRSEWGNGGAVAAGDEERERAGEAVADRSGRALSPGARREVWVRVQRRVGSERGSFHRGGADHATGGGQ